MTGAGARLSPATMTSLPNTLSGSLAQFATGQTVTYRLDNPTTGTVLSATTTPGTIPGNGTASVTVTIPSATTNGSHTVYAIGSAGDQASKSITVNTPTITTSVLAKSGRRRAGFIGANKTYYVYGNVTGSGNPPAGLASLTANVSNFTPGTTAAPMTPAATRSAASPTTTGAPQLTSGSSITAGSKTYSLTATDNGGSTQTKSFSATVDITAPSGKRRADDERLRWDQRQGRGRRHDRPHLQRADRRQLGPGRLDRVSTPVVVRLNDGLHDTVQIYNAANSAMLPLGTIDLGRIDYTTLNATFGASGTALDDGPERRDDHDHASAPRAAASDRRWAPGGCAGPRRRRRPTAPATPPRRRRPQEGLGNDRDF